MRTLPWTSPSITRSESPKTSPVILSPELILEPVELTGEGTAGSTTGDLKTRASGAGGGGAVAGGSGTRSGLRLTGTAAGVLDGCEAGFSSGLRHIGYLPLSIGGTLRQGRASCEVGKL